MGLNRIKKNNKKVFAARQKGRFLSFLSQCAGALLAVAGVCVFAVFCLRALMYGIGIDEAAFLALFGAGVGIVLYFAGTNVRKLLSRFRYYRRFMEGREYISMAELSELTGRKVSFLQQDLKKMMKRKLFLEARFNPDESCFVLTNGAYEKYFPTGRGASNEKKQTLKKSFVKPDVKKIPKPDVKTVAKSLTKPVKTEEKPIAPKIKDFKEVAQDYLAFYEEMQKKIKTKSVQKIVTDFGVHTVQILSYDIENEGRKRFLEYYLPVTRRLLLSYKELEDEGIAESALDLEDILNTIRYSFETFAEKLSEGRGMDVETDILALDTMLSRI